MALKLSGTRRWRPVKKTSERHGISVNFATENCGYVAEVLHSPNHSNMENIRSPKTKQALKFFSTNARKRRSEETCTETKPSSSTSTVKKPKRLSNSEVSDFMVKNNIRKASELMQVAL